LPASHNHVKLWNALLGGEARLQVKHPDGSVDSVSDIEKATAITLPDVVQWLHKGVTTISFDHTSSKFLEVEKTWNNIDSGFAVMYVTDTHTDTYYIYSGTPGIGKSVQFGNYVFYQAAKAKRNVFFDSVGSNVGYLFRADGSVFETKYPTNFVGVDAETDLGRDGLYLMDSRAKGRHREPNLPGSMPAFTIVTASPNEKHYGN
jgi:hypothetical protein